MKAFDGTPIATIIAANGVPFLMRFVRKGDGYGRNQAATHDKDRPLIEFYDARYRFEGERGGEYGQFISRYYADTLLSGSAENGLNLEGSVADWSIDATAYLLALQIIEHWTRRLI